LVYPWLIGEIVLDTFEDDDGTSIHELVDELEELHDSVDSQEEREQVEELIDKARNTKVGVFGQVIRGFTTRDSAEAFIGSFLFSVPLLVEGGVAEIGQFLSLHPILFLTNLVLTVGLVIGLLYVADIQKVEVINPIFGFIPRRLVGVLCISAFTATFLMTLWGRVDWTTPWVDACSVSVVFTISAIGASLGDILPGQTQPIGDDQDD
jgi:uncharacterized membrane protein